MSKQSKNKYSGLSTEQLMLLLLEKDKRIDALEVESTNLKEQIAILMTQKFGCKKDTIRANKLDLVHDKPLGVINEAEKIKDNSNINKKVAESDFSNLPSITIDFDIPESIKSDLLKRGTLTPLSSKSIAKLGTDLVKYYNEVSNFKTYLFTPLDGTQTSVISAADYRSDIIPGSIASNTVIANVIVNKYMMATPLYRQESQFRQLGINLSRQNMSNWCLRVADELTPLYQQMKKDLLSHNYIHSDETSLNVIDSSKSKDYMWVYHSSKHHIPISLYDYASSRDRVTFTNFIGDYKGYIHTDGYSVYKNIESVSFVSCFAHVQRKFTDIIKTIDKKLEDTKYYKYLASCIKYCEIIFKYEKEYENELPEDILKLRLKKLKKVFDGFFVWLKKVDEELGTKSIALKKAIEYSIERKNSLSLIFEDGHLVASNNLAERTVKPFVIGRKNWLFSNTKSGAKASAILYTVIRTAIENDLKVAEYLKYLLDELPKSKITEIEKYTPYSKSLPETIKVKSSE